MVTTEVKSIKIKSIPRPSFFGISSYAKSTATIGAELSLTGGHNTGLSTEEEAYFEKELSLKPGELNKHSKWWSDVFNVEHVIKLKRSKENVIYVDNALNELKHKILLASSKVANSEVEKANPKYEFFIDDPEAKAKKQLETINFEFEGLKLIFKQTPEEKRGSLKLFGKKGTDLMSESVVESLLAEELKKDPKNFFEVMTDKNLKMKIFVKELEDYKLISRRNSKYIYGDETIGNTLADCVDYFNDPNHKESYLLLDTKLRKAKKAKED